MSGHSSRRKNQLSEAQQYLDQCTSELRIYETTSFHNELVKQRYTYWQQEKGKAAAAKDRAELLLTDKQVEALELERHLRRLQDESYVETGLTYSSWSGERSGSQLVMPVQLLCRRTIGRCRPGRFLIPARIWPSDFSSLLDTEVEGRLTAYSEGPRSLQYLFGLHLPTGQDAERGGDSA